MIFRFHLLLKFIYIQFLSRKELVIIESVDQHSWKNQEPKSVFILLPLVIATTSQEHVDSTRRTFYIVESYIQCHDINRITPVLLRKPRLAVASFSQSRLVHPKYMDLQGSFILDSIF